MSFDERPVQRPRSAPAEGIGGAALAGLGIQFAVSLVAFYYLGQWLDRRLGTAPVFLLISVFIGAGASFWAMYRQLVAAQRREDAAAAARKAASARRPGPGAPEERT